MVSIWGLVSLYGVLIPQTATMAHVGWALRAMGLHNNKIHSMDPHIHSEIARGSPIGWEGCTWSIMPSRPQIYTIHLADDPRLPRWCGITYTIILALEGDLQASSICLETHEDTCVPPHVIWSTTGYYKGRTPCPLLLRVLFFIVAPMDLIRPLRGTYDMHRLLFDILRGLLFHLWASLVGLSPKFELLEHDFIFGAYVGQGG